MGWDGPGTECGAVLNPADFWRTLISLPESPGLHWTLAFHPLVPSASLLEAWRVLPSPQFEGR